MKKIRRTIDLVTVMIFLSMGGMKVSAEEDWGLTLTKHTLKPNSVVCMSEQLMAKWISYPAEQPRLLSQDECRILGDAYGTEYSFFTDEKTTTVIGSGETKTTIVQGLLPVAEGWVALWIMTNSLIVSL